MASTKPKKTAKSSSPFSGAEREAMQAKVKEEKAARRKGASKADGEADLLAKIAEMDGKDRSLAEKIHAIVMANAPALTPKTWYGMPAWANDEGKVVCFFQSASKFKVRYATFGFNEAARIDEGDLWATSFAVTQLGAAEEEKIAALVRKAVG